MTFLVGHSLLSADRRFSDLYVYRIHAKAIFTKIKVNYNLVTA